MGGTPGKLQGKQQVFADAYLGEAKFNATRAATIAGYKSPTASGHETLRNPKVRAYIDAVLTESALSRDQVLSLVTEDALRTDEDVQRAADRMGSEIVSSSFVSGLMSARTTARTNLMRAHGMFTDNVNHHGGIEIQIVGVDLEKL